MPLIKSTSRTGFAKDAIVLDLGDLHRQGEQIIGQARERAAQVIANGQAERDRLVSGAAEKGHAEGLTKGIEEGNAKGLQEGRDAALAEHRELLDKLSESWVDALERFIGTRQRLLSEGRREVVELAALIAEKVVKRIIKLDPSVVVAQLESVLALVMRPSRLCVSIHPADRPLLESALPAVIKQFPSVAHVELTDDDKLARGSCIARLGDLDNAASVPGGEIDASIHTQLDRIVEVLLPDSAGLLAHSAATSNAVPTPLVAPESAAPASLTPPDAPTAPSAAPETPQDPAGPETGA